MVPGAFAEQRPPALGLGGPDPRCACLQELSEQTEGFTGADLENLCQEAALMALREGMETANLVEGRHFSSAHAAAVPSLLPDMPGHRMHACGMH